MSTSIDPDQYVRENRETLVDVIKHGDDEFVRALAIAVLTKYGDEPDVNQVQHELETALDLQHQRTRGGA